MASTAKSRVIVDGDAIYFNPEKFKWENHADKVNQLFSEMVDGYPNVPTPRPTQAHTYDFGCTFIGAQLLDGECKGTATNADIGFMVLHCMDQLVTHDVALCLLMTSDRFRFYRSMKKMKTKHIETICCELDSYKLGPVDYEDSYRNADGIQKLPTFVEEIPIVVVGGIKNKMGVWSEHD